jgi:(p)ppGpp synthase/HD superfamily hydrolase
MTPTGFLPLTPLFADALTFVCAAHAAQLRKGTDIPYIAHLLGVAGIVLEYGGNEEEAIAALLHDAIEDQGARMRAIIERRYGPHVLAIVEGCTDTDVQPKPPWLARKQAYVSHVLEAPASTLLVSASDKLHNARALLRDIRTDGRRVWDRFTGKRDDTLWYYRALIEAFRRAQGDARLAPLIDELDRVVTEIEALAER